jgi:hypothetical protein
MTSGVVRAYKSLFQNSPFKVDFSQLEARIEGVGGHF